MKLTALLTSTVLSLVIGITPSAQKNFVHTEDLAKNIYSQPINKTLPPSDVINKLMPAKPKNTNSEPAILSDTYYIKEIPLTDYQQSVIYNICAEYNVEYTLALAMLKTESNFKTDCKSYNKNGTTDSGIAQINSAYYETYANCAKIPLNEFDPFILSHSVRALCGKIAYLQNHYSYLPPDTRIYYILNSYNMGAYGYKNFVKSHGYLSRNYDKKILSAKAYYSDLLTYSV